MTEPDPFAAKPPTIKALKVSAPRRTAVEIADIAGSVLKIAVMFAFAAYLVYATHGGH